MPNETFEYAGKQWWPEEFMVCMAWDAFRLAMAYEPEHFTEQEIAAWIKSVKPYRRGARR